MKTKLRRGYENRNSVASPQAVKSIYFHSIAVSISKNCAEHVKQVRNPRNTLANRIACEYVAQFLQRHKQESTLSISEVETNNYIEVYHDQNWIARRLGLLPDLSVYSQLIDIMGRDPDYQSTIDSEMSKADGNRKLQLPLSNSSKVATENQRVCPEDVLQSSDGIFTSFMTTGTYVEPKKKHRSHHKHHHTVESTSSTHLKSREYMIHESDITFTQLEPETHTLRLFKSNKRHNHKLNKSEKSECSHRSSRYAAHPTQTIIDTVNPEKNPSTGTIEESEDSVKPPAAKKPFLERIAALMSSGKYEQEVQTKREEAFPTLATSDFYEDGNSIETDGATGDRFEATSNVLAAFIDKMEGPEVLSLAPERDASYMLADHIATNAITDTQTAPSTEKLPRVRNSTSSSLGPSAPSSAQPPATKSSTRTLEVTKERISTSTKSSRASPKGNTEEYTEEYTKEKGNDEDSKEGYSKTVSYSMTTIETATTTTRESSSSFYDEEEEEEEEEDIYEDGD